MSQPTKKKKVSRKEIIHLSSAEQWQLTKETVVKLGRYMKPFKWRFALGVVLGIFSGLFNAVMLLAFLLVYLVQHQN